MAPRSQGLYNPAFEHDACGVAMVADMHGRRSRDIVDKAITALVNLEHRGAQGAEPHTGDGAGILLQVPDEFLRAVVEFDLPEYGSYATGIAFLPQSSRDAATACEAVEKIAEAEGLEVLGWREVPTDESSLGALARDAMPTFRQVFIAGASGMDLERRAYVVRKRAEHELGTKGPGQDGPGRETVYFPSLSGQTFVYKGMLTTPQLKAFYLDLQDDRLTSALGIVHSRFSTNTFPSWPLAHPFRVEQRQDVRMLEPGGDADLAGEAVGAEGRGELGAEHFDGDLAVVLQVVGKVHGGHAALAELALDPVGGAEGTLKLVAQVAGRGSRRVVGDGGI